MKHFIVVLFIMLFITVSGSLHAGDSGSAGDCVKGDTAYKKLDNKTALESYQKALETDPKNYEAAWKSARAYVDVGEQLPDKKERRSHYEKAYEYAGKAVELILVGPRGIFFSVLPSGGLPWMQALKKGSGCQKKLRLKWIRHWPLIPRMTPHGTCWAVGIGHYPV